MKITLELKDDITKLDVDGKATVDTLIAVLLSGLEGVVRTALEGADEKVTIDFYDSMDALFYRFMEKVFPDTQPRGFDFSDAAMIYAQDLIIEKAAKHGLTFEEAIKEFEDEAKDYVKARMSAAS